MSLYASWTCNLYRYMLYKCRFFMKYKPIISPKKNYVYGDHFNDNAQCSRPMLDNVPF